METVLEALLAKIEVEVKIIVLAIAGAKVDRKVKVTNIPRWPVSFIFTNLSFFKGD